MSEVNGQIGTDVYGLAEGGTYYVNNGVVFQGLPPDVNTSPSKAPRKARDATFAILGAGLMLGTLGAIDTAQAQFATGNIEAQPAQTESEPAEITIATPSPTPTPSTTPNTQTSPSATPKPTDPLECIKALPLDFKLYQKIAAGATRETLSTDLYRTHIVGGIVVMTPNPDKLPATDIEPTAEQLQSLKDLPVPIEVMVDQEGGTVQRIKSIGLLGGAEDMVPARTSDMTDEEYAVAIDVAVTAAESAYAEHFKLLAQQGYDSILGPVVDVLNPSVENPLPGRIYSVDPEIVSKFAQAFINGAAQAGMGATLKHAPGLGSGENTDYVENVVVSPWAELLERDLLPYQALSGNEKLSVMIGNQIVPDFPNIGVNIPSSRNPSVVQGTRDLGYQNRVTMTDALEAAAVKLPVAEAAVEAWISDIDLALFASPEQGNNHTDQIEEIVQSGIQAVEAGELDLSAVDASIKRILDWKQVSACDIPQQD